MRPRETPHTSTPIAGAQTSQAHTPSQDHEPQCLLQPLLTAGRAAPGAPQLPSLWLAQGASLLGRVPISRGRGCRHPGAMGRLQRSHGAEALAISASLLQADTVLGDGIPAASALPCRSACEPTYRQGLLRGYKHGAWTPRSPPHSRTTKPLSFAAACQYEMRHRAMR